MGDSGTLLLMVHSNLLVLLAGYAMSLLIGGVLYAYLGRPVARKLRGLLARTGEKLNQRSVAVRVWRGVILVGFLLFLSLLAAMLGAAPAAAALILAIFTGISYPLWWAVKAMRAAKREEDALLQRCAEAMTSPTQRGRDYHGALGLIITALTEHFALTLVGAGFWFVLLGPAGWFCYLALSACIRAFPVAEDAWRAFGWAAHGLFRLMDAIPALLSATLLLLASFFVPKTAPRAGLLAFLRARDARHLHLIAGLLNITLGGPGLRHDAAIAHPWIGAGSARIEPDALLRMLLLYAAGLIFLMVFLLFIIGL
jgi:adenosylcobinamide-phosphate synthase